MCAYYILETWTWPLELGHHCTDYRVKQNILVVRLAEASSSVCAQHYLVARFVEEWLWDQDQTLYRNQDLYNEVFETLKKDYFKLPALTPQYGRAHCYFHVKDTFCNSQWEMSVKNHMQNEKTRLWGQILVLVRFYIRI